MIPMVDLQGQYQILKTEIDAALAVVLDNAHYILGPNVTAFEQEAAAYIGCKHAISCASGTDALQLALCAAGIGPGDEVITTPFTFIATAEAICYTGATPVFVDILPGTFNIDPEAVAAAITPRTRAVLPVHLFGQPADLLAIQAVCEQHQLLLIEDCAQSFGAAINGRMTGAFGLFGCYSFFPSKNLGCYGDGGLLVCDDDDMAEQCRVLRNHGSKQRYYHDVIGYNSRLDEIQAAVLRIKLQRIDAYNAQRRRVAARYTEKLTSANVVAPLEDGIGVHVYHQYTLLSERRERIISALRHADIASAIYYPVPLHQQRAFADSAITAQGFEHTEYTASHCVSLPMYPELTEQQIEQITDLVVASA